MGSMRFITLLLILIFCNSANSQSLQRLDSLKQILDSKPADTVRLKTMELVFNELVFTDRPQSVKYIDSMFLMQNGPYADFALYTGHYCTAYYSFMVRKPDSALIALKNALYYAKGMKSPKKIADAHSKIALVYTNFFNDSEKGYKHNDSSITISRKWGLHAQRAEALYINGLMKMRSQEYDDALAYFLEGDQIEAEGEDLISKKGSMAHNTGVIYVNLDEYEKAETYYKKALDYYTTANRIPSTYPVKEDLGSLYLQMGRLEEAEPFADEALAFFKTSKDDHQYSEALQTLAGIYGKTGRETQALSMMEEVVAIKTRIHDTLVITKSYLLLGDLYRDNNRLSQAEQTYQQALTFSNDSTLMDMRVNALKNLSKVQSSRGSYNKAYENLERYVRENDSMQKWRNLKNIEEIQTRYETEKKEQQIALLGAEKEATEQKAKKEKYVLMGGLGLMAFMGVFFFALYRNRQKTAAKLKELNAIKTDLYANIAHEIRTPLTLIKGPVEKQLNNGELPENGRKDLELIKHNTDRMLRMVDQMLDLSKIESNTFTDEVSEGNLSLLVDELVSLFRFKASEKSIEINSSYSGIETVQFQRESVEKIISNLIENAIKYSPKGSVINLTSSCDELTYQLSITNPVADSADVLQIEKIFERHYRNDQTTDGLGIGLSLVRELVSRIDGTISAKRLQNNRISFDLYLPVTLPINEEATISDPQFEDSISEDNKPLILIVEDNEEIRNFTADLFNDDYNVIQAVDGSVGIELAMEKVPDIIISDVMMPKTDGVALCTKLKAAQVTSHIPIILLTAKVSEENELEGLQVGADSYVRKPFNPDILKQQVVNLLESRDKLRDRYSRTLYLEPVDTIVDSSEAIFIEQLKQVLKTHLNEPEFNAAAFAEILSMSRMQLHRKLKALFGLSTTAFIRAERVKASLKLLEDENLTISEIAYSVGFNTPSYYIKCFKEIHGVTPQEFSNNKA